MLKIILWFFSFNRLSSRPASCFPNHCFCEKIRDNFVRQPINAYTNLAFVIVGALIIFYLIKTRKFRLPQSFLSQLPRKILFVFGTAAIAVGIGSFLYHASFTFLGMELDDDSMYLIGSFMLFFALSHLKLFSSSAKVFIATYLLLNLFLETVIYFFPVIRGFLFALLVLGSLLAERKAIIKKKVTSKLDYFYQAIALFFIGYFFWILDYHHIVCFPNSLFQGHSLWHILSALAVWLMFLYYDSEYRES